jgi:hypothetical protein
LNHGNWGHAKIETSRVADLKGDLKGDLEVNGGVDAIARGLGLFHENEILE